MSKKKLKANWMTLKRVFASGENEEKSKENILKYMEQILFQLYDFMQKNVGITKNTSVNKLSTLYNNPDINSLPQKKLTDIIDDIVNDIAPNAVNVSSPYFVGHMTSAIPFFMVHLKSTIAALNQNVVKIETSKVLTVIEREVLAKFHKLIFNRSDAFYKKHIQNRYSALGAFIGGGTSANITALWVARNKAFPKDKNFLGIEKEGIAAAYSHHKIKRSVVLVSEMGHYSLQKAVGLLGIGNGNIISIPTDENKRMDVVKLKKIVEEFQKDKDVKIISIVAIAGTTETGAVDPIKEIGDICRQYKIYFHIDAAFGGAVLMSNKYAHLLKDIEYADSVSIDGHKQLYMPIGCGMVYFRSRLSLDNISYHAQYVNRKRSADLGKKSIEGSRTPNSFILYCSLQMMGKKGYELLINHGIELAKKFSKKIKENKNFEHILEPELNIFIYRFCPYEIKKELDKASLTKKKKINSYLNKLNKFIQQQQREKGKSFVSRTKIKISLYEDDIIVLRCVFMNPMTNLTILNSILKEQKKIFENNRDKLSLRF